MVTSYTPPSIEAVPHTLNILALSSTYLMQIIIDADHC